MNKYNTLIFILIITIVGIIAYIFFSNPISSISIEEIRFEPKEVSIYVGEKYKVNPIIIPDNSSNNDIIWKSNDEAIVSVDKDGMLSAISEGQTDITASSLDGKISDFCHIIVNVREVEKIEVNIESLSLSKGEQKEINAIIYPYNATYPSLIYQSSDENIITVDNNGVVYGINDGTAEVIIKDSRSKVETRVKVIVGISLGNIMIDKQELNLYIGQEGNLKAVYTPENTTIKNIKWSSSNESVAKVDQNGKVTGIGEGEVVITLTSVDTGKTATCKVKVNKVITPSVSPTTPIITIVPTTSAPTTPAPTTPVITSVPTTPAPATPVITSVPTTPAPATPIVPENTILKYEGSTLKYYIQNKQSYYLTYIWMEDPYNQIKKLDANVAAYGQVLTDDELKGKTHYITTVLDMANNYLSKGLIPSDKNFVAFNASGYWTLSAFKGPTDYYDRLSDSWLVVTDGKVTRNRPEDAILSTFEPRVIGISSSGNLKIYPITKNQDISVSKGIYNSVINDGVKNTWSFYPELINNGINTMWDDQKYAERQAICQVDSNNYIMFSSLYNQNMKRLEVANILYNLGCKTAFNLDGGGSISIVYKSNGMTKAEKKLCINNSSGGCRGIIEGIYFVEK